MRNPPAVFLSSPRLPGRPKPAHSAGGLFHFDQHPLGRGGLLGLGILAGQDLEHRLGRTDIAQSPEGQPLFQKGRGDLGAVGVMFYHRVIG